MAATRGQIQSQLRDAEFTLNLRREQLANLERDLAHSRANPNLADLIPSQTRNVERAMEVVAKEEANVTRLKGELAAVSQPPPPDPPPVTKPEPPKDDPAAKPAEVTAATPTVNTNPTTDNPVTADRAKPADNLAKDDNPASVNSAGQFIGLAVKDETGAFSNLKRNPETGELYDPGQAGTSSATVSNNTISGALNNNSKAQIIPRDNVLDKFSSYTYVISVYIMSPDEFTALLRDKKKIINNEKLLFQSGGAAGGDGGGGATGAPPPGTGQISGGRNAAFPVDFYIESTSVVNLIQGQSTGTAHNVSSLKFTVIETNGITLIDRIYSAVQNASPKDGAGSVNYSCAQYLMTIKWIGYDENGNQVSGDNLPIKLIPFQINTIDFSVGNKLVSYEFNCTPVMQQVAAGTRRGTVPLDLQINESTVGKILAGNSGKKSLAVALTDFNKELTKGDRKVYEQADEYEIEFAPGAEAIRDATLPLPGNKKEAAQTPMNPVPTKNAQSAGGKAGGKDITKRNYSITAGQPIVQVIEQIIRNSSYILDQGITKIDAVTGEELPNSDVKNKSVKWYRINFSAEPKKPYDKLRNDYAYKIKYIISAYTIDNYDSKYFPVGQFRGVHKSYPYWWTGENTAILDYSEKINTSYTQLVSGSNPAGSMAEVERRKVAATLREQLTYTYSPRSEEAAQGTETKGTEAAANLADSLYAPGDLANTTLKIVGDPAWIQQGSMVGEVTAEELNAGPFLPDGTVNFDGEQIFFEVNYKRPQDYNLSTGLTGGNGDNIDNGVNQQISRVYQATEVTSDFRAGKFEQTIKGSLFQMPKPDGSNKAPEAPMPQKTETREAKPQPTTADQARIAQNAPPGQTNVVGGRLVTNTAGGAAIVHPRAGRRGAVPAPTTPLPANGQTESAPLWARNAASSQQAPTVGASSNGQNIGVLDRFLNFISGQTVGEPQKIAKD